MDSEMKVVSDSNKVILSGTVMSDPTMISETDRDSFALFSVRIQCSSAVYTVSFKAMPRNMEAMRTGNYVNIEGYLYMYCDHHSGRRPLMTYKIYAQKINRVKYGSILSYLRLNECVTVIISGRIDNIRPSRQGLSFYLYSTRHNMTSHFLCYVQGADAMLDVVEHQNKKVILHGELAANNRIVVTFIEQSDEQEKGVG